MVTSGEAPKQPAVDGGIEDETVKPSVCDEESGSSAFETKLLPAAEEPGLLKRIFSSSSEALKGQRL
jgi:hypothetical protein